MPIDMPEATAAPTTRRAFLTRTAMGGAVVTAGAVAGPLGRFVPAAGAQDPGSGRAATIDDEALLELAGPLELAAVQVYQAAIDGGSLDAEWTDLARQFQRNHEQAADAVVANVPDAEETPTADAELVEEYAGRVGGGDVTATLTALAEIEELLAATHLSALGAIPDVVSSKAVARILAVESQQAVLLGRAAGQDLEPLTPDVASTEGARRPGEGGGTSQDGQTDDTADDTAGGTTDDTAGGSTDGSTSTTSPRVAGEGAPNQPADAPPGGEPERSGQ